MFRFTRPVLAGVALAFITSAAFASSSGAPIGYSPDPALKTASMSALTRRVQTSCVNTQANLQGGGERKFQSACGCYANKSLKSFSAAELQDYRDTGVFNGGARDKALQAIDACGLKRPF